jgi:hypothetical protein
VIVHESVDSSWQGSTLPSRQPGRRPDRGRLDGADARCQFAGL